MIYGSSSGSSSYNFVIKVTSEGESQDYYVSKVDEKRMMLA